MWTLVASDRQRTMCLPSMLNLLLMCGLFWSAKVIAVDSYESFRGLQEVDENLFNMSVSEFMSILSSEVAVELGMDSLTEERVNELWINLANADFRGCVEAENNITAASDIEKDYSDARCSFLACVENTDTRPEYQSGAKRKRLLLELVNSVGGLSTDQNLIALLNDETKSCYSISLLASIVVKVISAMNSENAPDIQLSMFPLHSRLKLRDGLVQDVLRIAANYISGLNNDISVTGDRSMRKQSIYVNQTFTNFTFPEPVPEQLNDTTVIPNSYHLSLILCAGLTDTQVSEMGDKILNIMRGKSPDGSISLVSYLYLQAGNLTLGQDTQDVPPRVQFWQSVYDLGVDSEGGCEPMLQNLQFTPLDSRPSDPEKSYNDDGRAFVISFSPRADAFNTTTTVACALSLAAAVSLLPQVCSVAISPDAKTLNLSTQWIVQNGNAPEERPFWDMGITGAGQIVAVSDSGLDIDNCYFWDANTNLNKNGEYNYDHRKVIQYIPFYDTGAAPEDHGTHVCGTLAGNKAVDGFTESDALANGVAKDAKIAFIDLGGAGEGLDIPLDKQYLLSTGNGENAKIHSASWGAETYYYDTIARDLDKYLYTDFEFLMVVAAGNSGTGFVEKTILTPGMAKNVLTVGATENVHSGGNIQRLADFSSRGPTPDGRTKPDVLAPGYWLLSANADPYSTGECDPSFPPPLEFGSSEGLLWNAGTSMATPAVSGAAALVRQYFQDGFFPSGSQSPDNTYDPTGTLVKAILMNGGQKIDSVIVEGFFQSSTIDLQMYDNSQNMGRIDLINSLPLSGKNNIKMRIIDRQSIEDGGSRTFQVTINKSNGCSSSELRATLVWADPPGALGCQKCLINDLDLFIKKQGSEQTYYPNGLSERDKINNAERIIIDSANDGETYFVNVRGTNLDRDEQVFALVITGCIAFDSGGQSDIGTAIPTSGASSLFPKMTGTVLTLGMTLYMIVGMLITT